MLRRLCAFALINQRRRFANQIYFRHFKMFVDDRAASVGLKLVTCDRHLFCIGILFSPQTVQQTFKLNINKLIRYLQVYHDCKFGWLGLIYTVHGMMHWINCMVILIYMRFQLGNHLNGFNQNASMKYFQNVQILECILRHK